MNYLTTMEVVRKMLSNSWHFLTGIEVPGFGGSVGMWMVTFFLCGLGIRLVTLAFGFGGSSVSSRTGSTRKPRISKERQGDTH